MADSSLYLLDASVIITANARYYPVERVPQFWDWLAGQAKAAIVQVPAELLDEITTTDGVLEAWLKEHRKALCLDSVEYQSRVGDVIDLYAVDLDETELEQLGKDPFLIAAAVAHGATVVTKEVSKPRKQRANRRIPDVCADASVRCIDDHQLIRELDFTTSA
jgi:hypothetical protein